MSIVTQSELESFIKTYLNRFAALTSNFSEPQKHLLLPRYLSKKSKIMGTISKAKGVGIKFDVVENKESIDFQYTKKPIEDEVLPLFIADGNILLVLNAQNQVVENVNLITREFYDKHKDLIEKLTRSTNFIMMKAPNKFVEVVSGDLKLIDCTLAYFKEGKEIIDRIDCLWLFSSNQASDFSEKRAELLAEMEYEKLVSILVSRIPIQTLIHTLNEYKQLIDNRNTTEPDMQTFFENNCTFLAIDAKRVLSKFDMGGDLFPDFVIETSDLRYIIVEIESPNVKLYTSETPPQQARKLREANSQIKSYLNYARNNILFLRQKLPLLSEEKTRGLIVVGRSSDLTMEQKKSFDQDRAYCKDYTIVTYDELFQNLRYFLENLGIRYGQI